MSKSQKRKQERYQETNALRQEGRREENEKKREATDNVTCLRERKEKEQKTAIALIVKSGYAHPLDPDEEYNQITALVVTVEDAATEQDNIVYRFPIVGFNAKLGTSIINIDQVTQKETKDSRVAPIKALIQRFESLYKKSGENGKSPLRAPIIVQRRFAGNDKDGVATYTYHLLSGHNRRKAYTEHFECEHVPAIIVGELEREDGEPCDQDTKDRLTRKLRRDANPQIDSNQYDKFDIAKMVYDEVTAPDSKLVVNSFEDLSAAMDDMFGPKVKPRPQCRKAVFVEFQKIDGSYVYCDMSAGTTASDMTDYGFPNPKKGKSLRQNNSILEENGMKVIFMSTDTGGTHLENAIGTLIKKWGEDQPFKNRTKKENIKDIAIHLKISNFDPEVASLRTARLDAEKRLLNWNNTFSMLGFPFRFHSVIFPQQLLGACTDSNSCVKL